MDYDTAQNMHTSVTYGWVIDPVVQGGPAASATAANGTPMPVQANDIIIGINGTRTINGDEMTSWVEENTVPSETVILTVARGNQTLLCHWFWARGLLLLASLFLLLMRCEPRVLGFGRLRESRLDEDGCCEHD